MLVPVEGFQLRRRALHSHLVDESRNQSSQIPPAGEAQIRCVTDEDVCIAILIPRDYTSSGIEFFTDPTASQQLGYMKRSSGYQVEPHWHKHVSRTVEVTQEVLFIRSGKCRLDLFGLNHEFMESLFLQEGDIVWLGAGGHGLEMLEECEIVEVKQGPYGGDEDKVRFSRSDHDSS